MNHPKISVIIPAYNSERHLRATLDSALGQDFDDFEIVVVDDGSTDGTKAILDSYADPRLKVFFEEHAGCVANYNRCLEKSEGEYIAILDHDDVMLPDRLRLQAAYLDSNLGTYLVGSSYEIIDEQGVRIERKPMPTGPDDVAKYAMVFNAVQHPTVMYRKALLQRIGVYDEAYYPSHDSEFILRAIQQGPADNLPEFLTQWRRVPDSPTNALADRQRAMHYKIRRDANTAKYNAYMVSFQKQRFALNLCKIAYYYGDGKEARRWAFLALRHGLWTMELFRYLVSAVLMPLVTFLRKRNIVLPFLRQRKETAADWTYFSP